ncbi:MAG: Eco57I restriction-modification methylase domain-containing protein [Tannerella sp.]|nr:Eco57I restriction-modification methylase domain-containing protein [Tannerella sp.]
MSEGVPISNTNPDKAFDWHKEFPQVFREKVKKAFHITTALHDSRTSQRMIDFKVRERRFNGTLPEPQVYPLDASDELVITQTVAGIVTADRLNVLVYNICCDHLHLLLVCEADEVERIVGKIKGRTAREYNLNKGINPLVKEKGERSVPLWTQKFGCREIESEEQLHNTIEYIRNNRIKHGLPVLDNGACPIVKEMLCTVDHAFRSEYAGDFDVVIGNPPYVLCQPSNTDAATLNYYKTYQVASYKIDLFHLFFEQGIKLLKANGRLGYITPNTYLTNTYVEKLRIYLLANRIFNLTLNSKGVFVDASVDVCTIFIDKSNPNDHKIAVCTMNTSGNIVPVSLISQSQWENNHSKIFNIQSQLQINTDNTCLLGDITSVTFGLQTKDKSTYVKEVKESDDWEFCYTGRDISKYCLQEARLYFKNCPAEVKAGGSWDMAIHHAAKIVVRQIGAPEPIFAFDKWGYATLNTMYSIFLKEESRFSYKYLLAVLCSSLIKKWWLSMFADNKDLFPKIKGNQLKEIPIKDIPLSGQQPFITLADRMLTLHAGLQAKRRRFLKRLADNFSLKLTSALEKFDELEFAQFLAELKKQKITLTLRQQDEWEEYFSGYKTECCTFARQIHDTDKEIDRLVYALYGLTEEAIRVIENS